jgi:2-keto-4-pentenoate hydratase/2-oxohepta-3-ene-1,7-dioic acid hydratase in catechol pathway
MRLIRFGPHGQEKPGILDREGKRRDLSAHFADWDAKFLRDAGLERLSSFLELTLAPALPEVSADARWASPVARPGKVICIGLNYSDHARESGMSIPKEPILFMKAANTVVGPFDDLLIPRGSTKTDWEVELGVILGKEARYLPGVQDAAQCIAGYCVSHDVSEREFQLERGGQWTKGKSCDAFNPLGPWLASLDEVKDPQALSLSLAVNGQRRQHGNTSTMIFKVFELVHYISQFMTLEPGDLISTGTPPGVGLGMKPPQFLKPGDIVELEIEGLGRQRQLCVQA